MDILGFKADEVSAIFQLVSAVLKLGNIQFKHHSNIDGTDGCKLVNGEGESVDQSGVFRSFVLIKILWAVVFYGCR